MQVQYPRTVCVIGAGPAGLAIARILRQRGYETTIIEGGEYFGGVWSPKPTNRVVYESLRTNIPTVVMQSPDLPFENSCKRLSFVTAHDLFQYFQRYATAFELQSCTSFRTTVDSVKIKDDKWEVSAHSDDMKQFRREFDAVAVANGHYEQEYSPEVPGVQTWLRASPSEGSRVVLHSKQYVDCEQFKDKSVLVVGARSSGQDIAREIKSVVKWLYVIDKKCAEPTTLGICTHAPRGSSVREDGRITYEGLCLTGEPIDIVVLATGYMYNFPFLDEKELNMSFRNKKYVWPLYKHLLHTEFPTLAFIGVPLAVPCPLRLFETQAHYVAEFWSGKIPLTKEERSEWVRSRWKKVEPRPQDMHAFSEELGTAFSYMRDLIRDVPSLDYESFSRNLSIVEEIYEASRKRKPTLPWDDDAYRDYNYCGM